MTEEKWQELVSREIRRNLADGKRNAVMPIDTKVTDLKAVVEKARLGHIPYAAKVYGARAGEFGDDKYHAPGNYLRAFPDDTERGKVIGVLRYGESVDRHFSRVMTSIMRWLGNGRGAAASGAAAVGVVDDTDGEISSFLPDLAHAYMALGMMIQKAVDAGLLPVDPGVTWDREKVRALNAPRGATKEGGEA